MSERSRISRPSDTSPAAPLVPERIGDTIKRARMSRGISTEALAKELKINPRYLEALEASDYDRMPGDTYIRVYLRSICNHFSLNPEDILLRFFNERGLTGVDTLRKDSSTKINLEVVKENRKPPLALFAGIVLVAILAGVAFIVGRQGCAVSDNQAVAPIDSTDQATSGEATDFIPELADLTGDDAPPAKQKKSPTAAATDSAQPKKTAVAVPRDSSPAVKKIADTVKPADRKKPRADSLTGKPPAPQPAADTTLKIAPTAAKQPRVDSVRPAAAAAKPADSSAVTPPLKPAAEKPKIDSAAVPPPQQSIGKTMKLRITVTNDSCWARVVSDGREWRKMLRKGASMSWTARDSFNVHVGASQAVTMTLDENPITMPGPGVVTYKVDQTGNIIPWSIAKWNSVFQNRP